MAKKTLLSDATYSLNLHYTLQKKYKKIARTKQLGAYVDLMQEI